MYDRSEVEPFILLALYYGALAAGIVWAAKGAKARQLADPLEKFWIELSARFTDVAREQFSNVYSIKRDAPGAFELKRKDLVIVLPTRPIEIGDPELDHRFCVGGSAAAAFAALSKPVRDALLVSRVLSFAGAELRAHIAATPRSPGELEGWIAQSRWVLEELELDPREVPAKLFANMKCETEPVVMLRQFELLLRSNAPAELKREAIEYAITQPDPRIRLVAATADGVRTDVLRELIELFVHAELDLREALLEHLHQVPADRAFDALLLPLLESNVESVNIAAAQMLGLVGTIAAIEPLGARGGSGMKSSEFSRVAEDAIRSIRARGALDRGNVSVAELGDQGALSVTGEEGALSIDDLSEVSGH